MSVAWHSSFHARAIKVPSAHSSNESSAGDDDCNWYRQRRRFRRTVALSTAGARQPNAGRLRELEQLRKDGLITQQEYEEKRKAILSTL
jgi:hypothetical protein